MKIMRIRLLALALVLIAPMVVAKPVEFSLAHGKKLTLNTGSVNDLDSIEDASSLESFNAIINNADQVVIDCYAPWCGPCKQLGNTFKLVAPNYPNLLIIKVNVDEFPTLSRRFNVNSLPTLIYFKEGKQVDKSFGALSKAELTKKLDALYA